MRQAIEADVGHVEAQRVVSPSTRARRLPRRPAPLRQPPASTTPILARTTVFVALALLCAYWFTRHHFLLTSFNSEATPELLAGGQAATPFQYRALVPMVVRGVRDLALLFQMHLPVESLFKTVEFGAVFLIILACRALLAPHFSGAARHLLSLAIVPVLAFSYLIPRFYPYWYPADLPAVFIFTCGLACLRHGRWRSFYPLFLIGTLNRETTCFLTVVMVLLYHDVLPRKRLATHVVAQALIWLAIKIGLHAVYAGNPGGGVFVFWFANNIRSLIEPRIWVTLLSTNAFLLPVVLLYHRRIGDWFIRRAIRVVPVFVAGMLCVATIEEIRVFGELAPLALVAAALIVKSTCGATRPRADLPDQDASVDRELEPTAQ